MKDLISKVRARKTKLREKQAAKGSGSATSYPSALTINLLIGFVFWLLTLSMLGLEHVFPSSSAGRQFLFPLAADGAFILVILLAAGLFLKIVRPAVLARPSTLILLCLISMLTLISGKALLYASRTLAWLDPQVAGFLLLFAFAPLLATILVDTTAGVTVGIWTGLILATMASRSLPLFICSILATAITGTLAGNVRTRSRVFKVGLVAGLSEITCVLGLTLLDWRNPHPSIRLVLYQAAACLASGFLSATLALLFLPLLEAVFHVTTDIRLLELSDLRHPLLQRLAIEAPGTYHHSLVVANLVQAAADETGANSLLARISAYFHDIGKLTKPEFFAENIQSTSNPHDDLPPSMSSLVITSHVKEGLSLAALYKLPEPIQQAIGEHHGTSLLSYFHYKAQSQLEHPFLESDKTANGQPKVDESVFRYPGPRPSTRESAIVCLADAVEAASRTMEKTTPGHVEDLVNDIVNTRIEDGQMDQCDLTIADLAKVKRSFVFTLTNMLHGRIPYPRDENRDKQPTKPLPDRSAAGREADGLPGAAG